MVEQKPTGIFDHIEFSWKGTAEDGKELQRQFSEAYVREVLPYHNDRTNIIPRNQEVIISPQNTLSEFPLQ